MGKTRIVGLGVSSVRSRAEAHLRLSLTVCAAARRQTVSRRQISDSRSWIACNRRACAICSLRRPVRLRSNSKLSTCNEEVNPLNIPSGGPRVSEHARQKFRSHLNTQLERDRGKAYDEVLRDALLHEDNELRSIHASKQGSTAALALVNLKHGLLVAANLGDSHVILAEQDATNLPHASKWRVKRLSKPHKPSGMTERRRIEAAGGRINHLTTGPRIGPVNLSRALGDHDLKQPLAGHIEAAYIARNGRITGDLVSDEAHTSTYHLPTGRSLILIASDGIGEEDEAEEAAGLAAESWRNGKIAQEIASDMTRYAAKPKTSDNCTAIVICLESEPE